MSCLGEKTEAVTDRNPANHCGYLLNSIAQHVVTFQNAGLVLVWDAFRNSGQGREYLPCVREGWMGLTSDCY